MSFSDSGLRVAHVVIWNWGVIYAIIFYETLTSAPVWQSTGLSSARADTAAAQLTNYFLFILRDSKNKCTSSDALFIDFYLP